MKLFTLLTSKNQYPTFRVILIDLATRVGACFPPVYQQESWKPTFLPPATTLRRQWLFADTVMKCYKQPHTGRMLCLPSTVKYSCSLTNIIILFQFSLHFNNFLQRNQQESSFLLQQRINSDFLGIAITNSEELNYSWDKMCSGFKHNCPLLW